MIYKVPKKDQYEKLNYFFFNFSAPDSRLPYTMMITMDFLSLNFFPLKNLYAVAKKLEINYQHMSQEELIREIKARIILE
jgi:hypothetical protein